jgi:hypothetical protein
MKIEKINLINLRNDAHFQFMTEVRDLIQAAEPEAMPFEAQFDEFVARFNIEDEALKKILKSVKTAKIAEADAARDRIFRGMADSVKSAANHYSASVAGSAQILQNLLDGYGNVAQLPVDEETSAIHNMLKDIVEKHSAQVESLSLAGWVDALDRSNAAVSQLTGERYDEAAGESAAPAMRPARMAVDEAYRTLTLCLEAFSIISAPGGTNPYNAIIARLNAVIRHTNSIVAQRKGRASAEEEIN